ncbi:MAG: 4-hydroxy-tetrahydrodipicolinate reductase [Eubacteriales bacterium]|nr:4-hydroxy-tetrahydrodipicolinate reductase [Eubacteriales bacterium]
MKIIIGGAMGRMGRELTSAAESAGADVVCGVDVAYQGQPSAYPIVTSFDRIEAQADALIDFSRPEGLPELLAHCVRRKVPAVLCATGYNEAELAQVREAAKSIAILRSANMSLGVNVLRELAVMAARALGENFDVEIVETHHRMKVDSPSGTALMLYDAIAAERGPQTEPVYGRYGRTQRRTQGEIGIHAVRGGTVTGVHEVSFLGNGEEIVFTHRAENRALFAEGALKAARFLLDKPAGLYGMNDVVRELLQRIRVEE